MSSADSVMQVLLPLPTTIPLAAAAITMVAGRRPRVQRAISMLALTAIVVIAAVMVVLTHRHGTFALHVGGWFDRDGSGRGPLGITLVADQLSTMMVLVSALVMLAVLAYSIGQGIRDGHDNQPVSIYFPTYLALAAGVCNAFLSGDLFNLYVSFEVLLVASFVLLTVGGTEDRVRAGVSYVFVSMLSSIIFLIGIAYAYAVTGTLNLAEMAVSLQDTDAGTRTLLYSVLLVAFGIKAAVFPMSSWLPDSYPTAPAPVTAVFAGLLTKVGVYAIIRAQTLLFPPDAAGHRPLDNILLIAAGATMLIGILGAIAQNDIKRLLSFTLVSHIGYMIFGLALGASIAGLSGAIFYVVHHILTQTVLFLVVGLIERQAGSASVRRLGGIAATSPLLGMLFFIPAMNLGGIPPFSGFLGKLALLQAGIADGSVLAWAVVAIAVITSLLTLYVMVRVWTKAFWRPRADAPEGQLANAGPAGLVELRDDVEFDERDDPGRMPISMVLPTVGLTLIILAMTVFAGPLFDFTDRAAEQLLDRQPYLEAVLGP